jgi:Ca-activated chloride channel family protein
MFHAKKLRPTCLLVLFGCAALGSPRPAAAVDAAANSLQSALESTSGALFIPSLDGKGFLPVPLLHTEVELEITGVIARASVRQRFQNPTAEWLEGFYVFPLPEQSAVDWLELRVGTRVIEGQIQERERARKTYERAKTEGRRATLLEQHRPNVFTTSVANIGPGEEVEVSIEYQEILHYDAGGYRLRFPMVVAPRYTPGGPLPPAEVSASGQGPGNSLPANPPTEFDVSVAPERLHPDDAPLHRVDLHVSLDAGFPIAEVSSPSHSFASEELDPTHRIISAHAFADRDFVLHWSPLHGEEPTVALFSEQLDSKASVLLVVLPPDQSFEARVIPREVVIVIDTSGSMGGASIRQARAALLLALDQLGPDDWFNVIAFDAKPRPLFPASVRVGRSELEQARSFVRALEAEGGTEMRPALELALEPGVDEAAVRQVIFITDGSIGNESELFEVVESRLGRSRLFPVGIGSAPNGYFLKRIARFGRGTFTFIATPSEVATQMNKLFAKLRRPVLTDIEVRWNDRVEMWPERAPDLYAGEPLIVTAQVERFVGDIAISGSIGGRRWESRLKLTPGLEEFGIGKLWARSKIAALMDRAAAGADREQIREEVTAVALEHHLVSKFTSLVAVDVTPARPADAEGRSALVPLHLPRGWNPDRMPGVLPRAATPAPLLALLGLVCWAGALVTGRRLWS